MDAPAGRIGVRSAYNVAGLSFSPRQLADAIGRQVSGFSVEYRPDQRQAIADSWPHSLDDNCAREDWGWQPRIGMRELVADMLAHLGPRGETLHYAA
jgi:nucleoside-diphosphate-sugar epimerase